MYCPSYGPTRTLPGEWEFLLCFLIRGEKTIRTSVPDLTLQGSLVRGLTLTLVSSGLLVSLRDGARGTDRDRVGSGEQYTFLRKIKQIQ